ncbi:uncharacterized protein IUM83_04467 [Phytophthora cinnamomi]|uniref:uncharacterized protein n=1 Tax=Phytophthora cinnamomi TaxID=4785 RepID=UPI003559918B|nr:putative membrane protein [Phytophthora cinnamomi]
MAEFVEMILAQIIGNISTALILVLIYFNFLLFENYLRLIVWAILCSQALRQAKNNVISVLQYLSDDADVERYGFLTCVFSKSAEIFISHPHDGSRRTAKELFLNYGIFLFSLIGAVSIWMRMYSWVSFLNVIIGFWIAALSLIKILDRRIFYYRYFFSDEVLVSVLLILGFFITGAFVILFLGTESYLEGSRAATDLSDWVQENFINDERTRQVWSEQVENSRAMISQAISGVENNYNDTILGIRSFFLISSMFYLLCMNWDPIERLVQDLLPIQVHKRPEVVRSLRKVIEGVFFLPLKMASIHAIVTMVSFTIVNADFMYLATTVTFFISIVPIIPPYLVCVPWVVSIGLTSSVVKALALFAVQYVAFTVLDEMLYEKSIVALNAYVSALSVVFGVYVFGFEGVIFGPLIVCGVTLAYDVSNHGIQAAQDEYGKSDEAKQDSLLDGSDGEGSHSTSSSVDGDDHEKEKESSGLSGEDEDQGLNTNIFSNAMYRVISGPLVDRVRRRLSIDIATEGSVCVTLVVEGLKTTRKVRFVVNKSWSQKTLHDNIRRMLHVHSVDCISTADGVEVLSPLHIVADEVLHVKLPAARRSTTNSSSRENSVPQPSPSPLVTKGLSTSTASLAQDYELLSPDEGFYTPGKPSSSDDGEGFNNADASTDVSSVLDLPSPASVGSSKKGKPKLNFVDLSDSGSFTTSPVSCDARDPFGGADDDNDEAEESVADETAETASEVKPLEKANRRISLKTRQGAKLIFSPLAVDPKKAPARNYSSSGDEDEKEK